MKQFAPTVWLFFTSWSHFFLKPLMKKGRNIIERVGTHSYHLHVPVCQHYRMYHVFYIKTHLFRCCMKHAVRRGLIEA